jgi:hypothetical protein
VTYVGPNAAVQPYCTQDISAELNAAVTSVLTTVKQLQDKAIAKNPGKVSLHVLLLKVMEGMESAD